MPDAWVAPEYVEARRALLDALELLADQIDALVLVGAQAVYLHAPASIAQQETYTTDSDLAVDPDLLTEVPDVGQVLLDAGYTLRKTPARSTTATESRSTSWCPLARSLRPRVEQRRSPGRTDPPPDAPSGSSSR